MIGTTVSHYRITASLGAGGMGEVYRATDTNLGRDVAIKVLPPELAGDAERLGRFRREAHLLASLNHPHIAQVYGFEHVGTQPLLVLELVEGEDLSQRLAAGPLPLDDALDVARQIAEALEEAHEKGIVHRDLKPANVKLTADGQVKVLDFGLAKALGGDDRSSASSVELSQSPTLAHTGTRMGVILGTAGYMSPEQARGKTADRRADIWAFGVVLFEMLTGERLFQGETVSDVLASVLKEDPDWSALPAALPARVRELLQRCLVRDPRRRLQSIGEARVLMEDATSDAGGSSPTVILDAAETGSRSGTHRWQIVSAVLAIALLASLGWSFLRAPAPGEVMRFPVVLPEGTGFVFDQFTTVAISRDGRHQVVVVRPEGGRSLLALKQNDQLDARLLQGTEGARVPFFSPDGQWVAYLTETGLYKVAVAGGPPVAVASGSFGQTRGGTWLADGTIVFTPESAGGLKRVPETGGDLVDLTTLDMARIERTHRWPAALPGGHAILFTSDTAESTEFYDDARIEAVTVATGERRVLIEQSSRAEYLSSGHLVFARGGALFAVPFDAERLEVGGPPVLVLQEVATDVASGAAQFSVSDTGSLLYVRGDVSASLSQPVRADRVGGIEELGVPAGLYYSLSLAPDDRRLAVVTPAGGANAVYVADLERGSFSRLTFESQADYPVWSPDGAWIAYGALLPTGRFKAFRRPADGSGAAELAWDEEKPVFPLSVSPDGKLLLAARQELPTGISDLWVVPLDGSGPAFAFVESPFDEYLADFSPDGRFVAYQSSESGRDEVYVRPFPGPGGRWQASTDGGTDPQWARDGRALYYRSRGSLYSVEVETANGFRAGRPEPILDGLSVGGATGQYSVSSDGKYVYFIRGLVADGRLGQATLLLNWASEVERLTRR